MRAKFLILPLILFTAACGGGGSNSTSPGVSVLTATSAPPALPEYAQPLCPGVGYLWTPGYWAFAPQFNDFYWVPGTWVRVPVPGYLWTPPYWAWNGSAFEFREGWWGPRVGFYGGIAYGYGYPGTGFQGGFWQGEQFYYNQVVSNVDVSVVRNVYYSAVANNVSVTRVSVTRVSYNGGQGGIVAYPTSEQVQAAQERRLPPTREQVEHIAVARTNPQLRASVNQGRPLITATERPSTVGSHATTEAAAAAAATEQPRHGNSTRPAEPEPQASTTSHKKQPPRETETRGWKPGAPHSNDDMKTKSGDEWTGKATRRTTTNEASR